MLVLEIGMFTATARERAEGLGEDGRLITCDVDPKAEAIARRYFAESPHGHKIEVPWARARYHRYDHRGVDMVFIDADK